MKDNDSSGAIKPTLDEIRRNVEDTERRTRWHIVGGLGIFANGMIWALNIHSHIPPESQKTLSAMFNAFTKEPLAGLAILGMAIGLLILATSIHERIRAGGMRAVLDVLPTKQ